jgi:hypothetical protein
VAIYRIDFATTALGSYPNATPGLTERYANVATYDVLEETAGVATSRFLRESAGGGTNWLSVDGSAVAAGAAQEVHAVQRMRTSGQSVGVILAGELGLGGHYEVIVNNTANLTLFRQPNNDLFGGTTVATYAHGLGAIQPAGAVPGAWYHLRARRFNGRIQARLWLDTAPEPSVWQIDSGITVVVRTDADAEDRYNVRAVSADELTALGAPWVNHWLRVEVENSDGEMVDLSDLLGVDWLIGARFGSSADQKVISGEVRVRREARLADGTLASMAPALEASPVNRDAASAYAPLLLAGRSMRVLCAVTLGGVAPLVADFREVVLGKIDNVQAHDDPIVIEFRDLGARLLDTFIQQPLSYGSAGGTLVELVMQAIIDDNDVPGAPTLYVPESPAWAITTYEQDTVNVMEAVTALAEQIGWDFRYLYDTSSTFRPTLYRPRREATGPDFTVPPSMYRSVRALDVGDADVRNRWGVRFQNAATGLADYVVVEDVQSIATYGVRYAEIDEDGASNINTPDEATAMAEAALADTSLPLMEQAVDLLLFWPVQVGNLLRFPANGVHYDTDQVLAVVEWSHDFTTPGEGVTTLRVRGTPAGAFRRWLVKGSIGGGVNVPALALPPEILVTQLASTTNARADYAVSASDGAALFYAVGDDAYPSTSNLANPGTLSILRSVNAGEDRTVRVRAVAPSGQTSETLISVDFDVVPEVASLGTPVPLYDGAEQVGWRVPVAVDDDTRALVLTFAGGDVAFRASSAPSTASGGARWVDTTTAKSLSVDVTQGPGGTGTVTFTPREVYNVAAGGLTGPALPVTLARAPITSAQVIFASRSLAAVAITVQPATASVRYRVDAGAWQQSVGNVFVEGLSVASADVVVEYQGVSATGVPEALHRLVIDQDDEPEIQALTLTEIAANLLNVSVTVDDDLHTWVAWARLGARPVRADGTTPDPLFRTFTGTRDQPAFDMRAAAGTWHVLARAYDGKGRWTEREAFLAVAGVDAPSFSNARARVNLEGAAYFNDALWDNNALLETAASGSGGAAWTIDVVENGVTLAVARDPRLDHDGTAGVALQGGFHVQRAYEPAPGGDDDVIPLTFTYTLNLRDGTGTLVQTASVQVSGTYYGPNGAIRATPVTTPVLSAATSGVDGFTVTWAPRTDGTGVAILVEREATYLAGDWATYEQALDRFSDPGAFDRSGLPLARYRVTVAWRNYAGDGPSADVVIDLVSP